MNIRFCWRYEYFFFVALMDTPFFGRTPFTPTTTIKQPTFPRVEDSLLRRRTTTYTRRYQSAYSPSLYGTPASPGSVLWRGFRSRVGGRRAPRSPEGPIWVLDRVVLNVRPTGWLGASETSPNRTHNKTQGNHEVRALQQPPNAVHAERAISKHPPLPSTRCPRAPQGRGLRPARREVPATGVATGP